MEGLGPWKISAGGSRTTPGANPRAPRLRKLQSPLFSALLFHPPEVNCNV